MEVNVPTAASGSPSAKAQLAKTCERSGPAIVLMKSLTEPDNLQNTKMDVGAMHDGGARGVGSTMVRSRAFVTCV